MIKPKYFPMYPEAFLRQPCELVKDKKEAQELKSKLEEMFPIRNAHGVACPQIGIHKKAFLVKLLSGEYVLACNAEILDKEKEGVFKNEGCLSFPGKTKHTNRFRRIKVKYFDEEFEERNVILENLEAVIFQHEVDHINGVLYKDNAIEQIQPTRREYPKIGRNEPCPCGSGKKYKKCCVEDEE